MAGRPRLPSQTQKGNTNLEILSVQAHQPQRSDIQRVVAGHVFKSLRSHVSDKFSLSLLIGQADTQVVTSTHLAPSSVKPGRADHSFYKDPSRFRRNSNR